MISVNCQYCNKAFDAQRKSAKFCSDNCRVKWNKALESSESKLPEHMVIAARLADEIQLLTLKTQQYEKQLQESLLLYNNQTATITKLEAENVRLNRLNDQLTRQLSQANSVPIMASQSPSAIMPIGQKIEAAKLLIKETTWSGDLQKVMKQINASDFPGWAKKQLQSFADSHRTEFTN